MKVPLLDLKAQYASLREEMQAALLRVFEEQHFILGEEVQHLEEAIQNYSGVAHAIGCASGSDALLLALMASEMKAGDAVITSPFTFFATVSSITRLNGRPLFVDIDSETFNLDPAALLRFLETACEKRSMGTFHRASGARIHSIIPVHLFGQCAEMDKIMKIAKDWKFLVIEDAAQALGAKFDGKMAGSIGDIGCYSFFPTKNLGGAGDGGMVVTNNPLFAERLSILRVHGSNPKYYHKVVGLNSRLDTLQAAVLLVKLKHLDTWAEGRRANASYYDKTLKSLAPSLITPAIHPKAATVYNQYCIRTEKRDLLRMGLTGADIRTEIYYPLPLHLQECFKEWGYRKGNFPVAEKTAEEILALPIYPELTEVQLQTVCQKISEELSRLS